MAKRCERPQIAIKCAVLEMRAMCIYVNWVSKQNKRNYVFHFFSRINCNLPTCNELISHIHLRYSVYGIMYIVNIYSYIHSYGYCDVICDRRHFSTNEK